MPARTAGRKGRPWRELRAQILAASDICVWCGHPGSQDLNHNHSWAQHPELRLNPANLSPIHGRDGCPHCPWRYSRRRKAMAPRVCNSELGARSLHEALTQRGSRDW